MFELGRLPHDPAQVARLPKLAGHAVAAMRAPDRLDRSAIAVPWGMDGNDRIGDCTAVGIANAARAVAAVGGFGLPIGAEAAPAFYAAQSGYMPGKPETDQGAVEADVLLYQARHGFDYGGQTGLVGLFATVDPEDLNAVRLLAQRCGSTYLGVNLALADQTAAVWDTATLGDQTPGSWGGHCLLLWDWLGTADTDICRLATWGMLQPATWRWVRSRLEEAHALMWRQLGPVEGVDFDRLEADVTALVSA